MRMVSSPPSSGLHAPLARKQMDFVNEDMGSSDGVGGPNVWLEPSSKIGASLAPRASFGYEAAKKGVFRSRKCLIYGNLALSVWRSGGYEKP